MSSNSFIEPLPINVFGSILSTRLVWTMYGVEPAVFTKLVSSLRDSSLSALVSFFKIIPTKRALCTVTKISLSDTVSNRLSTWFGLFLSFNYSLIFNLMLSILINKTSGGGRESNPPKTLKPFNSFEDCGAHQALIHLHK